MKTYNKEDNYCSYSPDRLFGITFNYACYLHDRQYRAETQIRKTRKQADIDFRNHIYKIFKNKNKRVKGWLVSRIYYYAVRLFSKSHYKLEEGKQASKPSILFCLLFSFYSGLGYINACKGVENAR